MTGTKYQVLARRYRPQRFSEVVAQESVVTTLKNALRFDKAAHAYLFCGSRGVGKTTLARLFAKALNCQNKDDSQEPCNRCPSCLEIQAGQSLDVIEIDGASNRGIDDIRQINETALYAPSAGRYKIYIVDEVHMLTKEAFNALLKTLEEPPEKAKFFFATTEPHKVLPTIVSRCQRFDLGRIPLSQIIGKLEQIASELGRNVEPEALHLIASFSDGALRDAESLFDQILCFAEGTVTAAAIQKVLGLIPQDRFFALDQAFSEARAPFAFELIESLFASGKDLAHFYEQLIIHVRNLASARLTGEKGLSLPPDLAARYLQSARLYAPSQCLYLLEYLLRSEQQIQKSACPRVALEAILLHYIQSKNRIPMEILVRRLTEMEEALKNSTPQPQPLSASRIESPNPEPRLESRAEAPKPEPKPAPQPESRAEATKPEPKLAPQPEPRAEAPKPEPKPAPLPEPRAEAPKPEPKPAPLPEPRAEAPKPEPKPAPQPEPRAEAPKPEPKPAPQPEYEATLKPAPFNPFAGMAAPVKMESQQPARPPETQIRYDTLMRFAAVELEGSFKIGEK